MFMVRTWSFFKFFNCGATTSATLSNEVPFEVFGFVLENMPRHIDTKYKCRCKLISNLLYVELCIDLALIIRIKN